MLPKTNQIQLLIFLWLTSVPGKKILLLMPKWISKVTFKHKSSLFINPDPDRTLKQAMVKIIENLILLLKSYFRDATYYPFDHIEMT